MNKEIKLTDREIEILEAVKTLGFIYITRDADCELFAYDKKPKKYITKWYNGLAIRLRKENVFNFIKWKDEEPTNIDDLLKEKENDS